LGLPLRAIFISYRRHDSEGEAGRLFDDLVEQFGVDSVFMDVAAIEVGRDFRKAIDESVAGCGVLLAIIGPGWLDSKNDGGERRLDDPNDFVRAETASALKRDIPLVPVLVRGAKMPRADQLPDDIKDLAYRNCVELTHVRWKSDIKVLIRSLRYLLGDPRDIVAGRGIESEGDSGSPDLSNVWAAAGTTESKPALDIAERSSSHVGAANGVAQGAHVATSAPIVSSKPVADSSDDGSMTPEVLARIARELAQYIGPIAEIVVRRAAKTCSTVADLRRTVAEEIDTTADRTKFLDACRSS
jgi:hypothetical protein